MDLHHPLLAELTEHRDTILNLRSHDSHFRHLFEEYHQVDDAICRIEEDLERASDQELEELKFRRVTLKDTLFHEIQVAARKSAHGHSAIAVAA